MKTLIGKCNISPQIFNNEVQIFSHTKCKKMHCESRISPSHSFSSYWFFRTPSFKIYMQHAKTMYFYLHGYKNTKLIRSAQPFKSYSKHKIGIERKIYARGKQRLRKYVEHINETFEQNSSQPRPFQSVLVRSWPGDEIFIRTP